MSNLSTEAVSPSSKSKKPPALSAGKEKKPDKRQSRKVKRKTSKVRDNEAEASAKKKSDQAQASDGSEQTNQATKKPELLPPWPVPEALLPYEPICKLAEKFMRLFMPKDSLGQILAQLLKDEHQLEQPQTKAVVEKIIGGLKEYLPGDHGWRSRLDFIFEEEYPQRSREFLFQGNFARKKYSGSKIEFSKLPATFTSQQFDSFRAPGKLAGSRMAPALHEIETGTSGVQVVRTVEAERFAAYDKTAMLESALHEEVHFNRPIYNGSDRWVLEDKLLPVRVSCAKCVTSEFSPSIVTEFIEDLRNTFAWKDEETIARYIGYLLQPMIAYLMPGQLPGYYFCGPPRAGKGYLSNALPGILYLRTGEATVRVRMLPNSSYEMDVFLNDARGAIYIVFDEVMHAGLDQLKPIDAALTSPTLQVRRFRHGYLALPNHYVIALTAVHASLTDETDGRLSTIELTESRPEKVDEFHRRWKNRGAELLAALFDRVNKTKIDLEQLPVVANRRPGFGLIAHVLDKAFGLKAEYKLEARENDMLDTLCEMFREFKGGSKKSAWRRFTIKNIGDFLAEKKGHVPEKARLKSMVHSALSFRSTETSPAYKESGYAAENGEFYHLKLVNEGGTHLFIYVRSAKTPKAKRGRKKK